MLETFSSSLSTLLVSYSVLSELFLMSGMAIAPLTLWLDRQNFIIGREINSK